MFYNKIEKKTMIILAQHFYFPGNDYARAVLFINIIVHLLYHINVCSMIANLTIVSTLMG